MREEMNEAYKGPNKQHTSAITN